MAAVVVGADGAGEFLTERKVPWRTAWRVMIPKKISMFSHEHPVGVKCKVTRLFSGLASHAWT